MEIAQLEVWGTQEKTEIGGFYVIGPIKRECVGCTAYVANFMDAKEIILAVNCHSKMLEHLLEIHNRYASLMTTKMANKTIEIIARAKGTNPKTV